MQTTTASIDAERIPFWSALVRDRRIAPAMGLGFTSGMPFLLTYSTWGNSGIEPDKGKGISSPGTYEASLMWPRNDGERQWSSMSDWTCR